MFFNWKAGQTFQILLKLTVDAYKLMKQCQRRIIQPYIIDILLSISYATTKIFLLYPCQVKCVLESLKELETFMGPYTNKSTVVKKTKIFWDKFLQTILKKSKRGIKKIINV